MVSQIEPVCAKSTLVEDQLRATRILREPCRRSASAFLWIGLLESRVPPDRITGTEPGDSSSPANLAILVVRTEMNTARGDAICGRGAAGRACDRVRAIWMRGCEGRDERRIAWI